MTTSTPKKSRRNSKSQPSSPSVVITQELTEGKRALASRMPISKILADNGLTIDGHSMAKTTPKSADRKKKDANDTTSTPVSREKTPQSGRAKKRKDVNVENVRPINVEISETPKKNRDKKKKIANLENVQSSNGELSATPKKNRDKKKRKSVKSSPEAVEKKPESTEKDEKKLDLAIDNRENVKEIKDDATEVPKKNDKKKRKSASASVAEEENASTPKSSAKIDVQNSDEGKVGEEPGDAGGKSSKTNSRKKRKSTGTAVEVQNPGTPKSNKKKKKSNPSNSQSEGSKKQAVSTDHKKSGKEATDNNDNEVKKVKFAGNVKQSEPTGEDGLAALRAARRKRSKNTNRANNTPVTARPANEPTVSDGEPRVVYVGHIPHGFYEKEMNLYFAQFGDVRRLRLSRSKKSGNSRGFAFVEFVQSAAADKAASAMNGYMMHGRRLKAELIPASKVHDNLFKGAERRFVRENHSAKARRQRIAKSNDPEALAKRQGAVRKRQARRLQRLKDAGVQYKMPVFVE